jgi:hypothetical protein
VPKELHSVVYLMAKKNVNEDAMKSSENKSNIQHQG